MDVASGRRGKFRSWHALTSIGSAASSVLRHRRCHIVTTVTVPAPSTAPSPSPAPPAGRAATTAADDDDDDAAAENIPVTNRSFWTRKIHLLCSGPDPGGGVDEALRLLDRLRLRGYRPDSLNLSSVVHGLCAAGRYLEAHRRLLLSVASGWIPDDRTANVLVARLLDARSPDATRRVVDSLVAAKPAFVPSSASYNRLIDQFCSQSRLADARGVFLDMKSRGHRPDVVSYTALIGGFGRAGHLDHAHQLFDEMTLAGVPPNSLTHSALIRGVLRARRIERAREMVGELWTRMEREEDPRTNAAAFANLVDAFSREGYFNEIFRLAEEMPQLGKQCVGEDFAYGQMIDSLCRVGRHHGASRVVYIMRKRGFTPSLVSYNCVVHGLSKQGEGGCMRAYQLLREGVEMELYTPPESTYKSLVEGLCRAGDVPKARELTEQLIMLRREGGADRTRIYNMFLNALRLAGVDPGEQLNVLVSMLQNRCRPDVVTLNTVIHGFCKSGRIDEALKILNDMSGGSFCAPDAVTFTTILQGLLDAGRKAEALDVLRRKMPACCGRPPSTRTYNVVLRGLCKLGSTDEAMEVFHEMVQLQGVAADSTTHAVVMGGLLAARRVDAAKSFWEDVVWPSHVHDDFVYAAAMKGLCGLGKLDEACAFLYELVDCGAAPGVVCYNIVVDGAGKLGSRRRAYQVVSEMRKNGLTPDAVTWRILERLHKNYGGEEREPSLPVSRSEGFFLQEESVPAGSSPINETRAAAGLPEEDCEEQTEVEGAATGGVVEKKYLLEMDDDEEICNRDDGVDADEMRRTIPAGDVCKVGSLLPSELTREPLSRVARRAFGLCV